MSKLNFFITFYVITTLSFLALLTIIETINQQNIRHEYIYLLFWATASIITTFLNSIKTK